MVATQDTPTKIDVYLWLDDERKPPSFSDSGVTWTWAKTGDEAIEVLKSGNVIFASLDHDLADEHYKAFLEAVESGKQLDSSSFKEKTGYDVLCWLEEHDVWPEEGVRIHTMNTSRKGVMILVVEKVYGRTFQFQIKGTHPV
jgi:hypothetical protein